MSDQFKIVVLLFYFAPNNKKTFYDRIIMYVCFCVRVWIHMHMYIYRYYANTYIMHAWKLIDIQYMFNDKMNKFSN